MQSIRRKLLDIYDDYVRPFLYQIRTWEPIWINVINRDAVSRFTSSPSKLSAHQQKIVDALRTDGIVATTLEELFPNEDIWSEINDFMKRNTPVEEEAQFGKKKFLAHYWGVHPELDPENPFFKLAIHPTVVGIANTYMRMWTKLKYYDLATSLVVPEDMPPQQSQNWHRDPEEPKMLKMFVYMTDVDEGSGPFIYVPGSTKGNRYGHLFPQQVPKGSYPDWDAVAKAIPEKDIRFMTAKRGTVLFCDTTGIHRGGYATKNDRTMFTSFYAGTSYSEKPYYIVSPQVQQQLATKALSPEQRFAIELQ